MPLFYQQHINQNTRLAIWKIEEDEIFFASSVPISREISHPHKRLQHLAGRFLLRYLFPSFPYEQILIASTKKPYLENEAFHFSISHCNDYAAAIVSTNKRVGIDVETISNKILKIVPKYLHDSERKAFDLENLLLENEQQKQVKNAILLWSIKESLFKWWGRGNVDFKEMLEIEFDEIKEIGSLNTLIKTENININLVAHYHQFNSVFLSFVVE